MGTKTSRSHVVRGKHTEDESSWDLGSRNARGHGGISITFLFFTRAHELASPTGQGKTG